MDTEKYYDSIAEGYDMLYANEQKQKFEFLRNLDIKGKKALDIGCGTGLFVEFLRERFESIVCMDLSQKMLDIAPKHDNVTYLRGDAVKLPFSDDSFDWIFSFSVMQDVEDKESFLKEASRVCSSRAIISVLKRNKDVSELKRMFEKYFDVIDVVEESKDYLFILKSK